MIQKVQNSELERFVLRTMRMSPFISDVASEIEKHIRENGVQPTTESIAWVTKVLDYHSAIFPQIDADDIETKHLQSAQKALLRSDGLPRYVMKDESVYEISYREDGLTISVSGLKERNEYSLVQRFKGFGIEMHDKEKYFKALGLVVSDFIYRFEGIEHSKSPIVIDSDGTKKFNLSFSCLKPHIRNEINTLNKVSTEELIEKSRFILNFVLHIADHDLEKFMFLLRYLFSLHYLGEYKLPTLVLYSRESGVGKTMFVEELMRLIVFGSVSKIDLDPRSRKGDEMARSRLIIIDDLRYVGRKMFGQIKELTTSNLLCLNPKYKNEMTIEFNGAVVITTRSERFIVAAEKNRDIFAIFDVKNFKDNGLPAHIVREKIKKEILPFILLLRRMYHKFDLSKRFILDPSHITNSSTSVLSHAVTQKERKFLEILFDPRNKFISETEGYYRVSEKKINEIAQLFREKFSMEEILQYIKRVGFYKRSTKYNGSKYVYYIMLKKDFPSAIKLSRTNTHVTIDQAIDSLRAYLYEEPVLSQLESPPTNSVDVFSDFITLQSHVERNKPLAFVVEDSEQ